MRNRNRNGGDVVDTRVGYRKISRSSSKSISDSSTNSEWLDVADTIKYKDRYVCEYCKKEFTRVNDVAKHIKNNCLINPNAKCNTELFINPYVCNDCGRRFKVRKMLAYHERHECQRSVICDGCNKQLVGASVSMKHLARCGKNRYALRKKPLEVVLPVKDEDLATQLILSSTEDGSD